MDEHIKLARQRNYEAWRAEVNRVDDASNAALQRLRARFGEQAFEEELQSKINRYIHDRFTLRTIPKSASQR